MGELLSPCQRHAEKVYHAHVRSDGLTLVSLGAAKAIFLDGRVLPPGDGLGTLSAFLAKLLGRPLPVLIPEQRHTAIVFTFSGKKPKPGPHSVGICDALITGEPGVALAVQTADCLPVALLAPDTVAVIHAGWRGLALGILHKTVTLFSGQFGIKAKSIVAAVGVGIGPCHYVVGPEVIEALVQHLGTKDGFVTGTRVHLAAFARLALLKAGLVAENISTLEGCTACDPKYHSYRRDGGNAGRQWTVAVVEDAAPASH